jgi:hypothetical protein
MFSSWTYYLIAGLTVALLALGWILKNQIETVGELRATNTVLQQQLATSEADKRKLDTTLQLSSKVALEDQLERDKLRSNAAVLNKQITSLKKLTKEAPKDASNNAPDDIYISDELKRLLSDSYCKARSDLCPNPSKPSS